LGSLAFLDGGLKYGLHNFRASSVAASTYLDALERHVAAWKEGEECDPGSGVPHLGHALACLAIIVDARAAGKFVDDRPYPGGYLRLAEEMAPLVGAIRANHAGKDPKHFYIGTDGGPPAEAAEAAPAWKSYDEKPPGRGPIVVRVYPRAGDPPEEFIFAGRGGRFRPGAEWRLPTAEEYLAWANSDD
jgi:hypothetical protein